MSSHGDINDNDIVAPRTFDGSITLSAELYDRYHDMYVALLAENQRLREAVIVADNALGWIAANHPAALRELPTAEFAALQAVSVTLARQLAAVVEE